MRIIRTSAAGAAITRPCTAHVRWRSDRLHEARGILADLARHPDTLVILAARVVAAHSADGIECADALNLLRLLDRRPLHAPTTAALPQGGTT